MMMAMNPTCDVCGKHESISVNCSATGAISFAYCKECLESGREPYNAIVAALFGSSNMGEVAEWFKPIIEVTLKAEGITIDQLFADVAEMEREYYEYCASCS